jgi:putative membrane protein
LDFGLAIALALALALLLLLALLALSAAWHVIRLHDYRLTRQAGGFRIECGLLTRRSATVPRERIQFLTVSESVLQRAMGRVAVRVETAGGGEEPAESRQWFAPLMRKADLPALLAEVHPALGEEFGRILDRPLSASDQGGWRPLAPRALRRMLKPALLVAVALATGCALLFGPWGALALPVLVPLAAWLVVREVRFTGYALTPYGIRFRSGALHRRWGVTFFECIQVASAAENPFDRRYGMASLRVDTAGSGASGQRIRVPYLPRETVRELRETLLAAAARAEFRWSA